MMSLCPHCFDTVGWVTERASSLYKLSGEVLAWLSVWSKAQMICIWSSPADATATSSSLAPVKSRMVYLSGAGLPRLSLKKGR